MLVLRPAPAPRLSFIEIAASRLEGNAASNDFNEGLMNRNRAVKKA
jgi:hypothetical protein